MRMIFGLAVALAAASPPASAGESNPAKPHLLRQQVVTGMPRGEKQEVRALTAMFKPGDRTVDHSHAFPVTVHVLESTFTLGLDGHEPVAARAGETLVEPPGVAMTRYNRSASEPVKVVIFHVGEPGAPFLDLRR